MDPCNSQHVGVKMKDEEGRRWRDPQASQQPDETGDDGWVSAGI